MRLRVAVVTCVLFAACTGEVIDMNEPPTDDGGLGGGSGVGGGGGSATGGGFGGGDDGGATGGGVGGGGDDGGAIGGGTGGATGGGTGGATGGGTGGATGGGTGGATGGGTGGATGGGTGGATGGGTGGATGGGTGGATGGGTGGATGGGTGGATGGGTGGATGGGTGGATGGGTGGATGGGTGGATGGGTGGATGGGTGGGATDGGTAASCSNITGDRATQVCLRWACDRRDMSEGTWSGNVASCNAGDMDAVGRANALKLINLYRFIANQPAVVTDATKDANAQACALMMDANNALNHTPPTNWLCYTSAGATAAGQSNICSGRAVKCIDMYISDYGTGNSTSIGHRRWLLSNSLGPVGIGGTTGGSCHLVIGGSGSSTQPWIAWPPPGPVPLEAINIPGVSSVDAVGWTVQSYGSAWSLANTVATVKDNGVNAPVTTTQLGANYGSPYAIRINPQGWTSQAGHTYDVEVLRPDGGVLLNYQVQPITCPPAPP